MLVRGGGGGGGTIVVNPEDLRRTSAEALDTAEGFQALAARLRGVALPEMPPGLAGRVSLELSECACLLGSEPSLLVETAQELRVRAFWAEVADRLAEGYELEGPQLAEFKAGMESGLLLRWASPWETELARAYADELKEREDPGGIGGFLKDVGGGIADFAVGAFDAVKDPAVMLYHLTPFHDDWTDQWGALGSGLAYGATHPLEFAKSAIALDALEEHGAAYWLGNLAPSVAAAFFTGGGSAAVRGTAGAARLAENTEDVLDAARDASVLSRRLDDLPLRGPATRPSWRQSEVDVTSSLQREGYRPQVSFKDGVEVKYGTSGSSRPELYRPGSSVEVKNYDVTTSAGRSRLVDNVLGQTETRATNLPAGTHQTVVVDVRGQQVAPEVLDDLAERLAARSNGVLDPDDILFLR
jgi:hypothetical protein